MEYSSYDYDAHVELIRLLRLTGDLDGARNARTKMSDLFALSEGGRGKWTVFLLNIFLDLWLQWLADESMLVSIPAAALELKGLYEKAVEDYLCKLQ